MVSLNTGTDTLDNLQTDAEPVTQLEETLTDLLADFHNNAGALKVLTDAVEGLNASPNSPITSIMY